MNKRVFFFVVSLAMTLFFLQAYFEKQRLDNRSQQREEEKKQERDGKQQYKDLLASPQELAFEFFSVQEGTSLPGVRGKGEDRVILSLSDQSETHSALFDNKKKTLSSLPLQYVSEDGLVIYSPAADFELETLYIDNMSKLPMQVLIPNGTDSPHVEFAEYSEGSIVFPFTSPPDRDGLAFVKWNDLYFPVGVYRAKRFALTLFSEDSRLLPHLSWVNNAQQTTSSSEEFYVLENDYFQIVFSTVGGSIREINFPFQSDDNRRSIVKEIAYDRFLSELSPENGQFPLSSTVHRHQTLKRKYTPLLRRDLLQPNGQPLAALPPKHFAFNILSTRYPDVEQWHYSVKEWDERHIVFETTQSRKKIRKTFTLLSDESKQVPYCFQIDIAVEGETHDLWLTSGILEAEMISGMSNSTAKYRITRNHRGEVKDLSITKDDKKFQNLSPDWLCSSNGFFGILVDPLTRIEKGFQVQEIDSQQALSRLVLLKEHEPKLEKERFFSHQFLLPLQSQQRQPAFSFRVFAGPLSERILKQVDEHYTDSETKYTPDYSSCRSFNGFFAIISKPIMKLFLFFMRGFHFLTHSWTLSIILLTIALRLMLYPINAWSFRSMKKMKDIAPKVAALQKQYQKQPKQGQIAIVELYRKEKVNPFGGCLPLLIQLPFLFTMFDLLKSTVELRGESFIPGWIDNLAAPDVLFRWETPLIFIGKELHLLPLLLAFVMFWQQKLSSPFSSSAPSPEQKQQKTIANVMNVVFAFMFYHFPSGLNIYWISSTLLGILQQWWMNRKFSK